MAGFDESYRTLLISHPARLSLKNSNLNISRDGAEDVSYPLRDVAYIVCESPQIVVTSALLSALAASDTILLSCDESHTPNGIFTPYLSHYQTNSVIKSQIAQTPQHKAVLWQAIIKAKIANQAAVLFKFDRAASEEISNLNKRVVLGDTKNCEATAAARYFRTLFGDDFDRDAPRFENSALNYAYAIIRACVARNIAASGLIGVLGIWHDNMFNNFNLADDLMEPFRPYADKIVFALTDESKDTFLSVSDKSNLIGVLDAKVKISGKNFTLAHAVARCVQSYKNSLFSGACELELPRM